MPNIVVSAVAKWNGTALKKGQKDLTAFQKSTNLLAKSFATAFAVRKLTQFGKQSLRFGLEATAQQDRLSQLLKVSVGATADQIVLLNKQAEALERIGVVAAGNVTQVQSQLATFDLQVSTIKTLTPAILDYVTAEKGAAASAADFKSMTTGLAQALNGNFASLTRVGFSLDDHTKLMIKSGSETERAAALVKVLESTYKGFNARLRETPAGKMQVLANAAYDVKTTIGVGIIDALTILSKDRTVDNLAGSMHELALQTADTIRGFGILISKVGELSDIKGKDTKGGGGLFAATLTGALVGAKSGGPRGALVGAAFGLATARALQQQTELGKKERLKSSFNPTSMYFTPETAERAKLIATLKKSNIVEKEKGKLSAAELLAKKKASELDKLKEQFDIERINLTRALENAKTDAERARIRGLLAIMDEDANAARARLAELDKTNIATMLANLMAASEVKKLADAAAAAAARLGSIGGVPIGQFPARAVDQATGIANPVLAQAVLVEAEQALEEALEALRRSADRDAFAQSILDQMASAPSSGFTGTPFGQAGGNTGQINNVTINNPLGGAEYINEIVLRAIQNANRFGNNTSYAGALP